jgi:shikimate kinase
MSQTIFMVGARGAGKTTVGERLASLLNYQFIDTDKQLQVVSRCTVAEIVERDGWAGFRALESQILESVCGGYSVIATGGGMVLSEANRQFMHSSGLVIYLRSPAEVLANRLDISPLNAQRPSLTGKPIVEEMQQVLEAREALYQDVAHLVINGAQPSQQVVADIQLALRKLSIA